MGDSHNRYDRALIIFLVEPLERLSGEHYG